MAKEAFPASKTSTYNGVGAQFTPPPSGHTRQGSLLEEINFDEADAGRPVLTDKLKGVAASGKRGDHGGIAGIGRQWKCSGD